MALCWRIVSPVTFDSNAVRWMLLNTPEECAFRGLCKVQNASSVHGNCVHRDVAQSVFNPNTMSDIINKNRTPGERYRSSCFCVVLLSKIYVPCYLSRLLTTTNMENSNAKVKKIARYFFYTNIIKCRFDQHEPFPLCVFSSSISQPSWHFIFGPRSGSRRRRQYQN